MPQTRSRIAQSVAVAATLLGVGLIAAGPASASSVTGVEDASAATTEPSSLATRLSSRTHSKPPRLALARPTTGKRKARGAGARQPRARASAYYEGIPSHSAPNASCLEFMGVFYVVVYAPAASASRYSNISVVNGDGTGRVTGTQRIGWLPSVAWATTAGWQYRTSPWWFGHDGTAVDSGGWGYWAAPPAAMKPFIGNSLFTGNATSHTFVVPGRGSYWVGQTLYWATFQGAVQTDFANRSVAEWNYEVRC